MPYCPACEREIPADAQTCPQCLATFGPGSSWQPLEAKPPERKQVDVVAWCFKAIGWILGVCVLLVVGAAYGIGSHRLFTLMFSGKGYSGVMLVSFLMCIPLAIGALVGYLAHRRKVAGTAGAGAFGMLSVAIFIVAAGAILREGTICILMAAPFMILLALFGAFLGGLVSMFGGGKGTKIMSVAIVTPFFLAAGEEHIASPTDRQITVQSIHIAAQPATIWRHINYPLDIKPRELAGGVAYRMGVPFPIEARTLEERIGGRRTLVWERGVTFDEEITAWEPNRYIAWTYTFRPDSFPEGSLDDHIVIGGRYFNLETTSYALTPEAGGTRLTIRVETRVTTHFNWYAGWWAKYLISDTAQAILKFYKTRSEAAGRG